MDLEAILIAAIYLEIEVGSQRSVGTLYALLLPFMCSPMSFPLPDKYQDIHQAIRDKWPGTSEGLKSLDKIKTIGWSNYEKLGAIQAATLAANNGE